MNGGTSDDARYAIYWAPASTHPLWGAGAAWLGRDPASLERADPPDVPCITEITREARLYGFHATLKPPMRLHRHVTRADVVTALRIAAAGSQPFTLPRLAVHDWHGFLCLREQRESAHLQALADAMVAGLDHLRAPISAREREHRRRNGLTGAEEANLLRWGYPHVFSTWFFHMTLTRRLTAEEQETVRPAAEAWFAPALAEPLHVEDVCLFEQSGAHQPFMLTARIPLGG